MSTAQDLQALNERREHIVRELAALGDVQSGSLAERYRRCGKPACHCATDGGPGHGPSWSLTRRVDGKTVTRIIAPSEVPEVQARVAEHRRLRGLVRELIEVSDRLWEAHRAGGRRERGEAAKKGGFAATVAAESAAEVERLIGRGVADGADFEAVETAARRLALGIMGRAVAGRLNADRSDEKRPRQPCACGAHARYAGRRRKTFTTALGEIELLRAWYHCENCGAGFSPRDRALGLEGTSLSLAALRMTGLAAARVSFAESGELLRELAGLDIDAKLAERQAEALGREIADDERHVVEPEPATARTLYLGLDGTGGPVRKAETRSTKGRSGKQPKPSPAATPTPNHRPSPAALCARPNGDASTRPRVARSSATARSGYGTGRTSTPPAPSRSSTSSTPRGICSTSPRPSTEREPISPTGGGNNAATNSIKAASTTSSPPSAAMPKPATTPASASTTSTTTATGCGIRSSGPWAFASRPAS